MNNPKQAGVEGWPTGALTAGLGIAVLLLDQATKAWARQTLPTHQAGAPSILDGWFSLVLTTNTGAAFGLLSGSDLLLVVVGVVLCAVVAVYAYLPARTPLLQVSLGLQLGGALSNLTDRLRIGHVVDFIQIQFWPIFNLADSAIVCGVGLLAYYLLFTPQPERSGAGRPPGQAPNGGG